MNSPARIRLEDPVRLSQSRLWQLQENYFICQSVNAWKGAVPFYISSNAFIGERYAHLVINLIKDWRRLNPDHKNKCFYIAETGAGSGLFSFHFLNAFNELLTIYQLTDQPFCYVLTDIVQKNLDFCKDHPLLKSLIQAGKVDCAIFNAATDADFYLQHAQTAYSALQSETPLIFIANYTLDCIKQDAFEYKNNRLHEIQFGLSAPSHFDPAQPKELAQDVLIDYKTVEIETKHYYDKTHFNEFLEHYQSFFEFKTSSFLLPLGAMQFVDNMKQLSPHGFFLITGDMGPTTLADLLAREGFHEPSQAGSFAFSLNFHALAAYVQHLQGDSLLCPFKKFFHVNLFSLGVLFSDLSDTSAFFNWNIVRFGPADYLSFINEGSGSIRGILSYLKLTRWDPYAYENVHTQLLTLMPLKNKTLQNELIQDLEKVRHNIYSIRWGADVYALLGIVYQKIALNKPAKELYLESIGTFGNNVISHYNLAVIYEEENKPEKAIFHYKQVLALDQKHKAAKQRLAKLNHTVAWSTFRPFFKGLAVVLLLQAVLYFIQD